MSTDQIREAINNGDTNYSPQPLGGDEVDVRRGTKDRAEKH